MIAPPSLAPGLELSPLFSSGAVLQRDRPVTIFGTGRPGAAVAVTLAGKSGKAEVGRDGTWRLRLGALPAGGPWSMVLTGSRTKRVVQNILVGEVWLASGQSNMEWPLAETEDAGAERAKADHRVRFFRVRRVSAEAPVPTAAGSWLRADAPGADRISAVAYRFAHDLRRRLNVPVGIVQATWGGSRIESWISRRMLEGDPATKPIVDDYVASLQGFDERMDVFRNSFADWTERNRRDDPGNEGQAQGWATPNFDDSGWGEGEMPGSFESLAGEGFEGAVWLRRTLDLPVGWAGQGLRLELGGIVGADVAYFNGSRLGAKKGRGDRAYFVGRGLPKTGANTIALRLFGGEGQAGVFGPSLRVRNAATGQELDLAGAWRIGTETPLAPRPGAEERPVHPLGPGHYNAVSGPFHGMIAPILPFAMRGTIFYQGEANVGDTTPKLYGQLLSELIRDWRLRAGDERRPFLYVQLPGIHNPPALPGPSAWARVREEQAKALSLPGTAMAVTLDLGDPSSVHPRRKVELADRLASLAFAAVYRLQGTSTSPLLDSWRYEGGGVRVTTTGVQWLKTRDGGPVRGFQIAGKDRKWVWAQARAFRNTVFVSADEVPNPEAVRYAWADGPDANLVSELNLPVGPFRTDDWPDPSP